MSNVTLMSDLWKTDKEHIKSRENQNNFIFDVMKIKWWFLLQSLTV